MKRLALAVGMMGVFLTGTAGAEVWHQMVSLADGERRYIDLESIQPQGDLVTFWSERFPRRLAGAAPGICG